jgi:hypothetical protein
MEKKTRQDGELREIPAPEAGALLLAGIGAFLRHGSPPGVGVKDDDYGMLCSSLSLACSRVAAAAGSQHRVRGHGQLVIEAVAR